MEGEVGRCGRKKEGGGGERGEGGRKWGKGGRRKKEAKIEMRKKNGEKNEGRVV